MRRRSEARFISREKTATVAPESKAARSAMLMASAVLPMEGRAAMTMRSPRWRPEVILSKA